MKTIHIQYTNGTVATMRIDSIKCHTSHIELANGDETAIVPHSAIFYALVVPEDCAHPALDFRAKAANG